MVKQESNSNSKRRSELHIIIDGLKQTEKEYIHNNYLRKLEEWIDLLDRADRLSPIVNRIANDTPGSQLKSARDSFDAILQDLKRLNFDDPDSIQHIKNRVTNFQSSGQLQDIANYINIARAMSDDVGQSAQLESLIKKAERVSSEFNQSFEKNLAEQKQNAARTLAKHYEKRIDELTKSKLTDPKKLLFSRNVWMLILGGTTSVLFVAHVIFLLNQWSTGYEIQILISKIAIIFLISSQVYFKQRNFNIYSDLVARYKHMHIIASTITDFLSVDVDQNLKEKLINSGVDTMFSKLDTGHLKQSDFHNREQINNIIGSLTPKT